MGREIKRVPENFNWPINKVWEGSQMPQHLHALPCDHCSQTGVNPETKKIQDEFYDSYNFGHTWTYEYNVDPQGNPATRPPWRIIGTTKRWCYEITQDEVESLVQKGRLMDFTHTWISGQGWIKKEGNHVPSAKEVNEWAQHGMGHDGINSSILLQARATRLGVYGLCEHCEGEGITYRDEAHKKAATDWEPTEPPLGSWWQVWETVSEGSPVTPAFATSKELGDYLIAYGDAWDQKRGDGGWSQKSVEGFLGDGWAPSFMVMNGQMINGARDYDKFNSKSVS